MHFRQIRVVLESLTHLRELTAVLVPVYQPQPSIIVTAVPPHSLDVLGVLGVSHFGLVGPEGGDCDSGEADEEADMSDHDE